ncbi:MAG: AMP-binding protein [Phycisphaerales bacterium]|jgi:long-chain acyl-CoA synthetase|nr:AMP-binding protein [Phycisphaerales bacterium]
MVTNIIDKFVEIAQSSSDRHAIYNQDDVYTYGQLLTAAQAVALNVQQNTDCKRVGLLAPTAADFVVGYFGILLADKTPVPLNFLLDAESLDFVAGDAGFDMVLASRSLQPLADAITARCIYIDQQPDDATASLAPMTRGDDDEATVLYTSGSTGLPKGVILTHRNLLRNFESSCEHIDLDGEDVVLGMLPLFHSFGIMTSVLMPLLLGCSVVYMARFSPGKFFKAIEKYRVTLCFGVASMIRVLVRAGGKNKSDLSSLRSVFAGGESLGQVVCEQFEGLFGAQLLEGYGLTETSPVVAFNQPQRNRRGSVGRLLNWVEALVVDDSGQPVASGEEGELWLKGDCVTQGYHNRPDEMSVAFAPDHWFKTGDLVRIDSDGHLWITGRKKDLIISAGENISPAEIEGVLREHPVVQEAAVIGIPDASRGEIPKAFVTTEAGAEVTASELGEFCSQHLPRHKTPASFEFIPEMPHGPTGKIDKRQLQ